jgi:RNA polymerase primary sigma factor
MSREQEEETLRRARKGDQEAAERLITSNLRFVVSVAMQYAGCGLTLPELISEGNVGLMKALERFDEKRGYKFISYAVWWIHQAIQRALKRFSLVHVPLNRREDLRRMAKRWVRKTQDLGRTPTLEEMSADMSISRSRAERALASILPVVSLDAPRQPGEEGDWALIQVLEDGGGPPDAGVADRERRELIGEAVETCLTDRERDVVRFYFGLNGDEGRNLNQIGRKLGLTREGVRQIKEKALAKLHKHITGRSGALDEVVPDELI